MKKADISVHCTAENSDQDWDVHSTRLHGLLVRLCKSLEPEIRCIPGVRNAISLACYFVTPEQIRSLNSRYRSVDSVTDMLSFPLGFAAPGRGWVLGDIIICLDALQEKAASSGNDPDDQFSFSLTHSLLHLLGFNHEEGTARREMESLEERVFADVGSTDGIVRRRSA